MLHLNLNSFVLLLLPFFRHKTYRLPCSISLAWFDGQLHLKVHSSSTDINGMRLVRSFANKPLWLIACDAMFQTQRLQSSFLLRTCRVQKDSTISKGTEVVKIWQADDDICYCEVFCILQTYSMSPFLSSHEWGRNSQELTSDLPFQAFRRVISHISYVLTGAVLELMVHCLTLQ